MLDPVSTGAVRANLRLRQSDSSMEVGACCPCAQVGHACKLAGVRGAVTFEVKSVVLQCRYLEIRQNLEPTRRKGGCPVRPARSVRGSQLGKRVVTAEAMLPRVGRESAAVPTS